jgi:hypothetical protein
MKRAGQSVHMHLAGLSTLYGASVKASITLTRSKVPPAMPALQVEALELLERYWVQHCTKSRAEQGQVEACRMKSCSKIATHCEHAVHMRHDVSASLVTPC